MSEWAPGVEVVPFRQLSLAALERASTTHGWGFARPELHRIREYYRRVGRDPTDVELAGTAQSWSEHCSYKSSRPYLKKAFAGLRGSTRVLGTGDAGVMRFEPGYAYALRIESHNHPSAVEPYGGAATGIGGILRDVLAVGAKPVALTDPLFFGPLALGPEAVPRGVRSPRYLAEGVVAGIRDYGNRVGVPTISGGVYFDPAYIVNPLVNVGCVGFLPRKRLRPNRARGVGDRLVLAGGLTGRDGIGGVAFASRELTDRSESESRGAVQLGNPIVKEPLIHASLEAFDRNLVRGVKDLGGGGLATAAGELAHAGGVGLKVDLARVPLRDRGLAPWEVWISESQERMLFDVRPNDLGPLEAIFRRYDVPLTDIGETVAGGHEQVEWHGAPAGDLDLGFRIEGPPAHRPTRGRPRKAKVLPPLEAPNLQELFEELVLAPDSLSRESVVRVYDHEVQGRTVVKPLQGRVTSPSHGDAAVLQPRPESARGIAITTAAQPWACREDPYAGAEMVVEEAARNLYAVGARPDAFSNCLNFGNPEDPQVMGDFARVTGGLARAARALGFAVPSGNVSFYNGGLGAGVPPTPVLLATGIVPDVGSAVTSDLKTVGDPVYLVGRSRPELGGSLWARRRARTGLALPRPDPGEVRRCGEALLRIGSRGTIRAAHDISDGGLAVTLAEMAFGGDLGVRVDLEASALASPALALVAEGGSRWVVEVREADARRLERACAGIPCARLGRTTDGGIELAWRGEVVATVERRHLYESWRTGLGLP